MLRGITKRAPAPVVAQPAVNLMAGEQIQASLTAADAGQAGENDTLTLTNRRIIRTSGGAESRRISFAAIEDITVAEIVHTRKQGYGAFIWAALAFFVAFMLWRIIETQTYAIAASGIVVLMGIYLLADRLMLHGGQSLIFKTGSAEIRLDLKSERDQSQIDALITKLFDLKEERRSPQYARAKNFAPR